MCVYIYIYVYIHTYTYSVLKLLALAVDKLNLAKWAKTPGALTFRSAFRDRSYHLLWDCEPLRTEIPLLRTQRTDPM